MTGKGHWGTGVALTFATYTFTESLGAIAWLATICSVFGSTAPDWLEIRSGGNTLIPHRTITHWIPLWLILFFWSVFSIDPNYFEFLSYFSFLDNYALNETVRDCLLGFSIGGLLHLLFDLPNPMGVPFLTPFHRISLNLWKSGSMEKSIVVFVFIVSISYTFGEQVHNFFIK